MTSDVLFEKRDRIAWITLNRADARNALTPAMCADLAAMIAELRADLDTRVVVLRGNGSDFTVGADLKDLSAVLSPDGATRGKEMAGMARAIAWPIFLGLHELEQPVVASVRGHVIGAGVQLVLAADLVVCSENARFLLPMARLGHSVDHGESYYLPRKLGYARAMQLLMLAETFGAADAERHGLVNWAVPDTALETKTAEVVERIAAGAPVALREMKSLLRQSPGRSITDQFAAEAVSLETCAATGDFLEAMNAFLEKRKPVFRGR